MEIVYYYGCVIGIHNRSTSHTTHIKEPDTVRVIILRDYETVSQWAASICYPQDTDSP